ncbi:lamin tail domain-containing protein [Leucobacter sp. GX24907]
MLPLPLHRRRIRSRRAYAAHAVTLSACAALVLPLAAATPAAAAPETSIVINEVIQSNDAIDDAVELMNIGDAAVDVSGWVVADDQDREPRLALPQGTVIEPDEFLAVTVDVPGPEGFGLGKEDMARLLLPDGSEVDRFTWSGHQPTSYGLNPDGVGDVAVTSEATPGAPNAFAPAGLNEIVINEVGSNGGDPGDWVELVNTGDTVVDLENWVLSDDDDAHQYRLPAGTKLDPGEYLALDEAVAESDTPGDEAEGFDFGLGGTDRARLFLADGSTLVDEASWEGHSLPSLGRCPNGVGDFETTASATKGAANDCAAPDVPAVVINEIETSGGTPDDWIEFFNTGDEIVDLAGFVVRDDSDAADHSWEFPTGTEIAPGEFLVVESADLGYGLGAADQARLFLPGGFTAVDQHAWDAHSPTTIGRCPDGTGDFRDTTASTKGAPNDCSAAVRINEVESSGDPDGDWIELVNAGFEPEDVSGMNLRDGGADNDAIVLPSETVIAAGEYLRVFTEPTFGLGGNDLVRLIDVDGTTVIDETEWTGHAAVTWGRCPDATGAFGQTREATPGAANACAGDLISEAWPGAEEVSDADAAGAFSDDMSGLAFDPSSTADLGILWAVNNGAGTLHRLALVDNTISEDVSTENVSTDDISAGSINAENARAANVAREGGRKLRYPDGTGTVDAEAVALAGEADVVFVGSERDNDGSGSRPSVLRYEIDPSGDELVASHEWNLTTEYPGIGANSGIEGLSWVSDAALVEGGLVDSTTGEAYDPDAYGSHSGGVFFVGVEATSTVAGYVLEDGGAFTRVTEFDTAFPGVMELEYEPATGELWAICDEVCDGLSQTFSLDRGSFVETAAIRPPSGMDTSYANEGLAFAPQSMCTDGAKPTVWADDATTNGHAFRIGALHCEGSNGGGSDDDDDQTGGGSDDAGNDNEGENGAGGNGASNNGTDGNAADSNGAAQAGDSRSDRADRLATTGDGGTAILLAAIAAILLVAGGTALGRRRIARARG